MKQRLTKVQPIYQMIYAVCLSAGLLLLGETMLEKEWPVFFILFCLLVFQGALYLSVEKKLPVLVWGPLLAVDALLFYLAYRAGIAVPTLLSYLLWEAVCLAAGGFTYYAVRHFKWCALASLAMVGGLIYLAVEERNIPLIGGTAVLFCFLFFLVEIVNRKASAHTKMGILYLTPLFLLSVTLLCFLPIEDTPIQWVTVKKAVRYVNEKVTGMVAAVEHALTDAASTYSMAGFDSQGKLEEKIQNKKKPQLTVNGKKTNSPLYLAGNIYATYTGRRWEAAEAELPYEEADYIKQAREMENWLDGGGVTPEQRGEISKDHTITIIYTGIHTESLFIPLNGENVSLIRGGELSDNAAMPGLTEPQGYGFTYKLTYTELDYANPIYTEAMYRVLEQERPADVRTEYIYDTYTQLPDSLPAEVRQLSDELTAECTNDYDRMKALEAYMANYTYNRNLGKIPEDQDYVAYFLFDRKEGYCTAYASALAVLGRCQGIPTRYVEGFAMARSCYFNLFSMNVTTMDSHAWVEAYFPGMGWVPFDGVPGYRERLNVIWAERPQLDAQLEGTLEATREFDLEAVLNPPRPMTKLEKQRLAVEIALAVLGVILFVIMAFLFRNWMRRRKYRRMTPLDQMKYLLQKILGIGAMYQKPILQGETLQEYEVRVERILDTEYMTFADACVLYEKARFGQEESAKTAVKDMEVYQLQVEKMYLNRCKRRNKMTYYLK